MSRKTLLYLALAVLIVGGLIAGVAVSRAQGSTALPRLTPAQLLADMATKAHGVHAIHGDFTWTNNLVPGADLASLAGRNSTPTSIASLITGGKGRLWVQGGEVRLEAQGQSGDLTLVAGKGGVWTYASATNTATRYTFSAGAGQKPGAASPEASASPKASAAPVDPLQAITDGLNETGAVRYHQGQRPGDGRRTGGLHPDPHAGLLCDNVRFGRRGDRRQDVRAAAPARVRRRRHEAGAFGRLLLGVVQHDLRECLHVQDAQGRDAEAAGHQGPEGRLGSRAGGAGIMNSGTTAPGTGQGALKGHAFKPLTLAQARTQAAKAGLTLRVPASAPASLPFTGAAVCPPARGRAPWRCCATARASARS